MIRATLVAFNSTNGVGPTTALTLNANGHLFGTTGAGSTAGMGTAFELSGRAIKP